jgi:hypothetical protein
MTRDQVLFIVSTFGFKKIERIPVRTVHQNKDGKTSKSEHCDVFRRKKDSILAVTCKIYARKIKIMPQTFSHTYEKDGYFYFSFATPEEFIELLSFKLNKHEL